MIRETQFRAVPLSHPQIRQLLEGQPARLPFLRLALLVERRDLVIPQLLPVLVRLLAEHPSDLAIRQRRTAARGFRRLRFLGHPQTREKLLHRIGCRFPRLSPHGLRRLCLWRRLCRRRRSFRCGLRLRLGLGFWCGGGFHPARGLRFASCLPCRARIRLTHRRLSFRRTRLQWSLCSCHFLWHRFFLR